MKELAIKKLDEELKKLKGDRYVKVMQQSVHDALVSFCNQEPEFAQAVVQGGSFADCMKAVAQNCGSALSDLEAYRRAVQFYFPGADVRFQMSVHLCASVDKDAEKVNQIQTERSKQPESGAKEAPVVLDLFDLL